MAGSLYLGRWADSGTPAVDRPVAQLPADRFTTHAVVIGMTGSGKTGLLVDLLEEATLAGIPSLVIDPKGDLTDRLLVFPEFREADFAPFCPPGKAEETAARWKGNLASWGIGAERVRALAGSPVKVFTPGSSLAPVNVLDRFAALPGENPEASAERALGAVASLLALAGVDADASTSPEGLLLNQLLLQAWSDGDSPSLEDLVQRALNPPIKRIGILDLDAVIPPKDRTALAMRLNALLASPSLAAWRSGPALDFDAMLGPSAGASQTIFTLPHLSEGSRLFFLGLLLSELASWTRRQKGSDGLRALVLFDEIFGFFPPHPANPPTKGPLLTLLKQARAFGVGLVLASQNPVDLDYKGLTNAGLWFLGRLQTEPDRRRVADALGDLPGVTNIYDFLVRQPLRTFLVHDVREGNPRLLETRPCISYLAGPLTGSQLEELIPRTAVVPGASGPAPARLAPSSAQAPSPAGPPPAPAGWAVAYAAGTSLIPHLEVEAELAFKVGPKAQPILQRRRVAWPLGGTGLEADLATDGMEPPDGAPDPRKGASCSQLPSYFGRLDPAKAARSAAASLAKRQTLALLRDPLTKLLQDPPESEAAFRARLVAAREEARRAEEEKTLGSLGRKLQQAEDRVRKLEMEVEQEKADASARSTETVISAGLGVLGGIFGSKRSIGGAISRTVSKQRMASRAKGEVIEDQAALEAQRRDRDVLKSQVEAARADLSRKYGSPELETVTLSPSATGVQILSCKILFAPTD